MVHEQRSVDQTTRDWARHWEKLGPVLEELRRQELREFRPEDHPEIMDAIYPFDQPPADSPTTSGRVELQRVIKKSGR